MYNLSKKEPQDYQKKAPDLTAVPAREANLSGPALLEKGYHLDKKEPVNGTV